MERTLGEERLLKELEINSWREMSKAKVVKFASKLHKLDPEVAKKALEQFPRYAEMAVSMIGVFKDIAVEVISSNSGVVQIRMNACLSVLSSLQKQLETEELTDEARDKINTQMIDVARELGDIDRDNKNFLLGVLNIGGKILLGALGLCAIVLGASGRIGGNNDFDC